MNMNIDQSLLDAARRAAEYYRAARNKGPSWASWREPVHETIAALCRYRDLGLVEISAQGVADVIHDRHGVLTSCETINRYCRAVLGRKSFATPGDQP